MPVHSESRQPTISSSSAIASNSCARSLTSNAQPFLDRVPVDAAVLEVELVGPVRHLVDRLAWHQPQRLRLAAPAVLLPRPRVGERGVRCHHRAGVRERLPLLLLPEDLVDRHRYAASKASRTQPSCSRKRRRSSSLSCERGPWPV